jgi:hypothetical protein
MYVCVCQLNTAVSSSSASVMQVCYIRVCMYVCMYVSIEHAIYRQVPLPLQFCNIRVCMYVYVHVHVLSFRLQVALPCRFVIYVYVYVYVHVHVLS